MSAIDQITNALADQKDIEAVHIVSHGSEGSLKLGADVLNEHNLETFSTQIKQWGNALTANGDILLYGCDVAAGEVGENFVKRLSEITGADVAASTNKTGNAALGGDWNLEYSTGKIESPLAFKSTVLKDYQSTLGTLVSETFTGSSVTGPWIWALAGASTPPGLTAGSAPNTPLQNLNLDTAGNGALRLTSANTSQAGFVLYNNPLSSTEGVKVTFDFFAYNGVGSPPGDGLSFFLVDGTANPTSAGNGGGGLGYNTLIGGYVGIGFDEYGGFGSTGQDSVAIRGSTASSNTLLQSVSVAGQGGIDAGTVANRNTALRRAQIILTPSNAASPNRLSVAMDFNNNGSFTDAGETIIAPFDITTSNGAVPTTLKFGFAASTGGSTDVHEIRNLIYETVDAPPTVTTFTPADNATTVAVAANLVVTLSEAVQKGTGNIVIKKVSDNSVVETINVTAANVTVSGSTVTVNPTADLAQGTGYYVEIAAGAIKDLAGNNYAGTTGATTWNFTTVADTTAPTAATFTPADNATTVAVTDNLVVTLSEAVQKGTGNIVIKKVSDNSVVETINVTAANVTVSGSTVTVNPTADLAQGTGYYVEIAAGAIKDLAGNNYAGTTGATTWNFTTVADTTAPTAATFTPADNATTVAVTDNLVVTLSEAVQKGTGNIVIKKVSDNSVVETINVTAANVTVSGSTVTVNPTADLAQGTGYYVEIAAGAIKDLAGNNYAGTTGATTWNFTTVADTTAPTAATFTPADNATTVAVAANLVVTLSEAVQKGTGNIVIKKVSDNSVVETINVTAANVTVSGSTVTVNPTADLAQGTGYYVEIAAGAIKDLAGNNYAGTTGATTWNFTTVADTTAPTAATFTPADNATTVAVTDNLVVTLSEAVQKGTGNIVIKKVSDNSVVETINVTAANVTVSGSTVTVNPTADLAQGTGYYVEIAAGAIKDLAGNNYAGTTGATTWNFTTVADTTAPTAATFTPADNATTVAVTDNLVVTLSEAVQKGTGNIVIKKVSDNSVVETINVTAANVTVSGSTVTVNPTADLAQGTGYYVEIAAGAIKDLAGNNYAGTTGATTWNFTTVADTTAPTAATFTPADNATTVAVAANLVVTLSEAVQKGTGNIVIKKVSDNSVVETINVTAANVTVSGSTVTVNPTADLAQGTGYYVEIAAGAIKDLAGNNYAGTTGATTWNFTTVADTTAPTAATFTPADNATTVAVTDNLVVTLSEAVQKGTGNIVIKKVSDNSVVETINVTAANVTVSGSTVTVNPTADLAQGTGYYVEIAAGAIKDLAGNNYAGTTGATTWNFTTVADTTAPTAATFTPADNATTVAVTDNLVVTLSEAVQKGTGNIVIKKVSDNSVVETINVTAANVTVSGSTVTVNPTADLAQGTGYYVEIAAGAIKDLAGNNYAGTTGATTWNFTTVADTTAPTAATFTPADNATTVAVTDNLVVTLSEAVQKGTGNIVIKKVSDNSVVETINVTSANVTVSGSTVTVNPTADLAQGTGYYVEIAAGAIKDLAGNNYAGTTGATTWNFTTVADTTAPTAATFTPADNATTVAVTDNLVVTLSEAVQKGTGNIVIKKVSDNSVVETINVTAANVTVSGSTVTVNPTADLAPGTDYYVEIASGAIQDLAGNNYAGTTGATTWNFTTVADTTAPTAATFTPADNATTVAVTDNLVVTLSEAVQKGTGNIVIKKVSDNSVVETINVTAANVTVSGSTVTVNPTADLAQGTGYYVEIAAGAIKDLAGNNYAGTTGATTWNFTTVADTTAPTAATFTPADNATTVAVTDNLVVTLSEAVQKGTGNIVIKKVSDNSVVETINVTAANVTVSGSTVTVNPTADLAQGTGYYVEIAAGAIQDLAGNNYAGTTGATTWNFTTVADTTAPTAATFTPADNATTVAVTDNLVVTLSEAVQKGTGNIVIKKVSDNSVVETINVTAANVTVSGSTVTVNPTADLAQGTGYYVEIAAGAIKDLAGNNYAGTTGATTWNFTTVADTTAPTAATFTPADNATTVAVTDNLVVTLSEAVQKGTGNIVIKKVSDNSVVETINVTAANVTVSGSTVTVNPTADLAPGTDYYVEIASGAIQDLAGNNYAGTTGATTWNFTTVADTTAPTAATFTPADNATTVAVTDNLVVTLSEAVQKGTGNIVIKKVSDNSVVETINVTAANVTVSGSTVTVNPTADLAQGTGYYVEIAAGAIKDLAGNNYAGTTGATTWNFTTVADTTAPTAATFTPADNATTVAVTDNLVVTLSEAVQKGTGNIVIKKVSDNSVVETINVTSTNVTVTGSSVTINPVADLAQSTDYYVEIAAGAIKDIAGNNYAGTTGATAWNFTTADTTAPTVTTFTPADNATTVAVAANLVVTLSEAVQKGTGNIVIKKVSDNSVVETINVTAANVTVSGSTVTVNPTLDLVDGTDYYVEIAAGAIQDLAGNNYAGTTGATAWNFTTAVAADTTPPTATFTPLDNATTVAVTANLVVTLSEAVQKGTGNIVIKKVSDNSVVETINVTAANVTVSGSTVTVNPTLDLVNGTDYYVEIAAGAIQDLAGNNYAGTTGATAWNFTTAVAADTTPPTATFTPLDNATTVAVTANLVVTLSEAVQKGTGNIVIKKVSDNSVVETINVTAANVTVSGSTVTVNPTADLAPGTDYYVEIAAGAIQDLAGNNYAGTTGATTWNFTTAVAADTTPPTATFTPLDNATNIAVAANLVVTLSEAVQKGTGNIVIKKVSDNSVVETINVTAANVTVSGSTVTVNPTADLAQGTGYYVEIAAGAIKDLAGNNYAGTTGATAWNFNTADTTAPTVTTFTPADNATNIAVAANLVVTLSEAVQKGTGNIVIKKVSDNSVVETINVTAANVTVSGSTVTVNPTADLAQGTGYYVEIAAGAIKDLAGNNYSGITGATTWNFTTADTTAPTVTTFTPVNNATTVAVAANAVVTLSEAVQKGTGNIVIKKVSDNSVVETINVTSTNVTVSGSTVTVNPTADLAQGTGYYVEIAAGAIKDLAGNNYAGTTGATAWNFTTADTTPPTAATFTPLDNATTVAVAANVVVTLSEAVQKGTGNIVIKKVSDNSVVETINVTSTNVTVSGSTVTVNPTADLAQGTGYYVEIAAGAIKDLAGNNYAGTTGATTWNFTTADTTAPTVTTFTPVNNATTVAVTANAVVTLSEAVQKGTGNIVIKKVSDNSVVETINVTSTNVTVSGSTVTVNPTADLAQGTGYYVEIAAGAIKDLAGNNYAGITGATAWKFNTADTTAPTATTFTPVNNATTVAVAANAVVTLSEAVQKGTGNIVIKKVSDNSVVETINVTSTNVTVSGSTVTVNPTADLAQGTGYYVEIAAGAIKDLAGNNYAGTTGATTWNFTTADTTAPTVTTFTPVNNATTVAVTANAVVAFSEAVQKGTGNIVIKKVSDNSVVETINVTSTNVTISGSTVTIDPTNNLADNTQYYVEIANGAIKDLAGNNYSGITNTTDWNFTNTDSKIDNSTELDTYLTNKGINVSGAVESVLSELIAKVNPLTVEYQNNELTVTYDGEVDFSKFADLPHLPLVNKITADLTIPISQPSLTISELNSPTPTYKLGGKVNFEEEKDSGKPNVLDFINEQLKIKEIELETEVNTSKGELSVTANLSTEKLTLLKVDPLWIELTDATFNINTTTTSTPKFGIGGSVSITGYDPFQDNEPELNVSADIIFQPESITSKLKLAPTQTWKNPFGLPDSEIRNFTIQLGGTYAPPWIDNVGFMGDLKFGNFDIQAAFAVDSNDPKKFAVELTANNPINIVDLWAGPVGSYLIKQVGKEVGFVKTAEGFLKEVLDLNIKSIDGNADKILDPLLKLVPFNTEIGETKLTKGFGINGQINLWGKDVILSLNANPYDVINPSLNGSLKIDEIDWGFLKLTGADGDNDKTLDLNLKVDTTEQYLKGDGKLEVFGATVAKANFEITPTSVKVKDYDVNFGVVALDINDFSLDIGNKTASGSATLKLLGNEIAAVQINGNEKDGLTVQGNIDLFGVVSIEDATIDVKNAKDITIKGTAKIFGQTLEYASISIKDGKLEVTGGIGYDIPEIGNVGATLTITSDGRPSSSQMAVSFSAGPLGGVQYTILDLAPLRSIEDVFDQAIGRVLGVVTEAVNKAIDGVVTGFNTVSSAVLDTFDKIGAFLGNPVEGAIEIGIGIVRNGVNIEDGLDNNDNKFDAMGGNDKVWGNGGNDWLIGGGGEDYLNGEDGNDKLEGSTGHDSLRGESGDDQLFGQQEQDSLYGGDGNDLLDGGESGDLLYGGAGNDLLDGGPGNDGDDLNGDDGNDKLQGRDGNDILRGKRGDDLLYGDQGNDRLYGDEGTDFLIGGDGDDLLAGWDDNDRLNGDHGNDTLEGQDGNDQLHGYQGNDSLDGGNGNDVLYGQGDNDFLQGGDGDDALYGEDNGKQGGNYDGSHDNDKLEGGNGKDKLFGGLGDDFLSGGNDNDLLSGEAGNDKLNGDGGDDFLDGGDGNDSLNGGSDNDTLFGRNGNDFLEGFDGNDYLYGGDGNDQIYSHDGDDILKGEAGDDAIGGGSNNDLLDGGDGNDSLYGEGGYDTLSGGNGSNVLDGGDGIDVADYRFATGAVEARLTNGKAWFSGNVDKFISIENIIGSANNDTLVGSAENNTLSGQAGDDKLFGESGNDQLKGEEGNDELHGWEGDDKLFGDSGNDLLIGQDGNDELHGWEGNDTLQGGVGNDTLYGQQGDDNIQGEEGNDYLDGGAGNDTIDGGAGNDILLLTGQKEDYKFTETATGWRIVALNGDVKIVTGVEKFQYLLSNTDFNLSSVFDRDVIFNYNGGATDPTQDGLSTWNETLLTQSFATFKNPANGNGLPDNGFFRANAYHPDVQLGYNNTNNGNNAKVLTTNNTSFTLAVTPKKYSEIHLFATSTNGNAGMQVTFKYSDGNTETIPASVPDWFDEITETSSSYYLINGMDRSKDTTQDGYDNTNDPALFGFKFNPNSAKMLQSITVTKTSGSTTNNWLGVFGATGVFRTKTFTADTLRTYYKSRVIDGYIGSGKVFFDANLNGMLDEAEPFTITRADGSIDLNVDIEKFDINKNGELDYTEGQFVLMGGMDIIGGVDAATGLPMATPLTSTLASTVVTPLTTAIASMVQQGADPATAETQVKSALGLPAGVDLGSYDPLEAIAKGDTNGVSVFGSMILVQNTIVQTAKFIEGVSETAVAQLAFSGIGAIANQLKGGAAVDLGKTETILAILQGAITKAAESDPKINPTQLVASAAAASQIMALGNQIVKDVLASGRPIKDIALDITKLQAVSVGQIAVGLSDLAAGTVTVEDFLAQNSQEAILARMETVKVNDPTVRPVVETIALKDPIVDPEAPTSDGTGTTPDTTPGTDTPTSTTAISGKPTPIPLVTPTPKTTPTPSETPSATTSETPTITSTTNNISNDDCICDQITYPKFNQPNAVENTIIGGAAIQIGTAQNDELLGSNTGNIFNGKSGDDNLYGGAGNDIFNGNQGNDFITGGKGDDILYGDEGNDIILGESGNDLMYGGKGNDLLHGREGTDIIYGNKDDDFIDGGKDNDTLYGGKGNDILLGSQGDDNLFGQDGDDTICGGEGNDLINGDAGADILGGCAGNDTLYGGADNDTLTGGKGDDLLDGGMANDSLIGGSGNDIFVLKAGQGFDIIADFTLGQDLIGLTGGLSFGQLEMTQNTQGTILKNLLTGEQLGVMVGVSPTAITSANFMLV